MSNFNEEVIQRLTRIETNQINRDNACKLHLRTTEKNTIMINGGLIDGEKVVGVTEEVRSIRHMAIIMASAFSLLFTAGIQLFPDAIRMLWSWANKK